MSTHKHFDKIVCVVVVLALLLTVLFMNGEAIGIQSTERIMGYENRLFDHTRVHTIDIVAEGWDEFLQTCTDEEYISCAAVIDGEAYKNIAIRAKGNTSLTSVKNYGNDRYSFKLEFDHYDSGITYHGLDKLCLNNLIQDNTLMKDFLVYQMMRDMGVPSPLCSFAYITVNGEDWGLYLAVEAVEDSFLQRNYGSNYGELYKPDSMSFGGGRGNGKGFDMGEFTDAEGGFDPSKFGEIKERLPEDQAFGNSGMQRPDHGGRGDNGGFGGMGSADVKLQYIDDDPDSYQNIFGSAKTDISDTDEQRLIEALKRLSEGDISAVDAEDVLMYFAVHNFVCNGDSYTGNMIHNYYLYEKDGALSMLPWDYNLAFGAFDGGNNATAAVNSPIDTPVSGTTGEGDRPMIAWIFSDEQYTELYHECLAQFMERWFESGWAEQLITDTAELISPYAEKDPTKFCTFEEFKAGVEVLRKFVSLRAQSVQGQLNGSIPSTTEGQSGSSALVDASHIDISAMGSMGEMGGHGGQRPDMGDFTPPDRDAFTPPDSGNEAQSAPEQEELPQGMEKPQGMMPHGGTTPPEGMAPPDGMPPQF